MSDPDRVDLILEQWRRERPDLDLGAMGVLGRLQRTARLIDTEIGRTLAHQGLAPGWFDLLATLRRAGEPYELNPTQLAAATMLSSAGTTKRLDRLEQAGLIRRRPDLDDRRGTRIALTPEGRRLVDRSVEAHITNEQALIEQLCSSEREALDRLLRKLLAGLERD